MNQTRHRTGTSLLEVIGSVAAAFFGVQSSQRRRRDFTHGKPWHYVVVGLLMTAAVVAGFWAAVQLALRYAH